MGAWGEGIFENDDALDWLGELEDMRALDAALGPFEDDYLDVDIGSAALAAAEVVASIHGHPAADAPEQIDAIVRARRWKPSPERAAAALRAIDRVTSSQSEVGELWAGNKARAARIEDLRARLSAAPVALAPRKKPTKRARRSVDVRNVLELPSPTGAFLFGVSEIDSPAGANTQGAITFASGGSGLFMIMGVGLGITARWTAENALEITVPRDADVTGPLGPPNTRVGHFGQFVDVAYVRA